MRAAVRPPLREPRLCNGREVTHGDAAYVVNDLGAVNGAGGRGGWGFEV